MSLLDLKQIDCSSVDPCVLSAITKQLPCDARLEKLLENYIVFDIETTGFNRFDDRIIEIAAVEYKYQTKIAEFHKLINPEVSIPLNITALTGIAQADVADAPTIHQMADDFFNFIGSKPLVGHNALTFDLPFLVAQTGNPIFNTVVDTLPIARAAFPGLPRHKLQYLKDVLQLSDGLSHQALADVYTTAALLQACLNSKDYEELYKSAAVEKPCKQPPVTDDSLPAVYVCDTSALRNKNIVFTGELQLPRAEAKQLAVAAGAVVKGCVSKKTHYLVVGTQDISIVGMDGMSNKEETAHELNSAGKANIQIITEEEFITLLETPATGTESEHAVSIDTTRLPITEQAIYEYLMDASATMLEKLGLTGSGVLQLKKLDNTSVVQFIDKNHPVCYIRSRKTQTFISFFVSDAAYLLADRLTLTQHSTPPSVRVHLSKLDDVSHCVEAFRSALVSRINEYRTFDCCSRYMECSNAKRCVHPKIYEALGCTYGKRLRDGIIYYGKNKTV